MKIIWKSACRGLGPCQMFWKLCTDHLGTIDFGFWAFLQNRQKTTIKSSTTDYFAYFGAPGVLKTAPACNFHYIRYGKTQGSVYL